MVSLPAIAEQDETHDFSTPYGRKQIQRKNREALHPAFLSPAALETQRRAMTEYNFAAQYQQNPQPHSGVIVQRKWLKFYELEDRPREIRPNNPVLGYRKQGYRAFQL